MVALRAELLKLKELQTVKVKFNGAIYEGVIVAIRQHAISLPDFRMRFPPEKTLYWVSGIQIVL